MINLRHLAIRTRDLARTGRFYEEGLGLRFVGYRPSGTSMDLSDGSVNLDTLAVMMGRSEPLSRRGPSSSTSDSWSRIWQPRTRT